MLSTLFSFLSDLFYPHNCPGCGEPVPGPLALCDRCREGVYHPRPFHPDSLGCPHLDGLFFLFDYAGAIQEALHKTKFEKREDLLPRLAREWQAGVAREGRFAWQLPAEVDLGVTAIPTDPVRRKQRGLRCARRDLPALGPEKRVPVGSAAAEGAAYPAPVQPDTGGTEREHPGLLCPGT
jgi:predicted amidophosphoribosyltransferase